MSTIASVGVLDWVNNYQLACTILLISYLLIIPLIILFKRVKKAHQIKKSTVTSAYKQPLDMSPVEMSYVFSSRIKNPQMYATVLHLSNRSVLQMHKKAGKTYVDMGPKIDKNLKSFEKYLVMQVHASDQEMTIDNLLNGYSKYKTSGGDIIDGSKQYVFWWLLRDHLQKNKLINKHMLGRYIMLLFKFGVVLGLVLSTVPLTVIRFLQMINAGEVETDKLVSDSLNGLQVWALTLLPLVILAFLVLKFRGRMLGRDWLMTNQLKRFLNQAQSFREFVRLANKGKLKFDSKLLEKDSTTEIQPYAIACGYKKTDIL